MTKPRGRRVWIVLGWDHASRARFVYSSTAEQRWHWTHKSAKRELDVARIHYPGTNWMIVRMVPIV